jgi:8-oxo-dGTP pyrophosphatase MutT (NUDIX family)
MTSEDRRFERIDQRAVYEGRIVRLMIERYRFPDGEEVEREIVRHDGAVGMLVHDDEHLYLVRQPREAIDDPDFLEIPAGRLDKEGESPLEAGKRELVEEIGKTADNWEPITAYVSSAGMSDEVVHLYYATGVREAEEEAEAEHNERIEIVRWPLNDLDGAIAATRDSKTLIALYWLKCGRS